MTADSIPCWLTKCQAEQARKLVSLKFELVEELDLFAELDIENADEVDDWRFIAYLPDGPCLFDEYPKSDQCSIYALCNQAIYLYWLGLDLSDYDEAEDFYFDCEVKLESAKQAVREVAQSYADQVNQLCLI